jgi:outer membrane protease
VALAALCYAAHAADFSMATPASLALRSIVTSGQTFSAEFYGGYLTGTAGEYVYAVPGDGLPISQLDWQIDNAAILGGRVSYQAFDGLSLRASGWSIIASENDMDDFDWFDLYTGFESWTHWSHTADTRASIGYQIDLGGAARVFQLGNTELNALFGYRSMTFKMKAYGGRYIYSGPDGFRDYSGNFPVGQLGIAYQQWWHTPYLGLGGSWQAGRAKLGFEVITSPFVASYDKDHHKLRDLVFEERFSPTWMVGVTLGAEYALMDRISVTGRVEYEKYFEASGGTRVTDATAGTAERFPKPSAGADLNTLAVTVGLKIGL